MTMTTCPAIIGTSSATLTSTGVSAGTALRVADRTNSPTSTGARGPSGNRPNSAKLRAISGSKNVTEMSDFNVGLYLPDGAVATMGRTILFHSANNDTWNWLIFAMRAIFSGSLP